jgi:predicted GNAT family N-acyltransferase
VADRIVVEKVEPARTYRLRRDVLRPGLRIEDMGQFGDDGADAGVFGAVDRDTGEVVGTAIVRREDPPDDQIGLMDDLASAGRRPAWRLRAMATKEDLRGTGIGARVLEACVRHVAERGGGLLWCNARVPAQRFYERGGFVAWGEQFESVGVPHVVMWRLVEAEGSGT